MQVDRVFCLFEQSGAFKNEFIKMGYCAEDYDIQNEYGQTDHIIDLFAEIEKGWAHLPSIFDQITPKDLVLAFFPCIYFNQSSGLCFSQSTINFRHLTTREKYEKIIERAEHRAQFYILLNKLFGICEERKLPLIFENPATPPHYLFFPQNFIAPTFIDKDRSRRGDYFRKPTAYWFLNCKPTTLETNEQRAHVLRVNRDFHGKAGKGGICNKDRSAIAPEYARNFICDFILGKEQENTIKTLF